MRKIHQPSQIKALNERNYITQQQSHHHPQTPCALVERFHATSPKRMLVASDTYTNQIPKTYIPQSLAHPHIQTRFKHHLAPFPNPFGLMKTPLTLIVVFILHTLPPPNDSRLATRRHTPKREKENMPSNFHLIFCIFPWVIPCNLCACTRAPISGWCVSVWRLTLVTHLYKYINPFTHILTYILYTHNINIYNG